MPRRLPPRPCPRRRPPAPPWPRTLLSAPHRLLFAAAALLWLLVASHWALVLAAQAAGHALPWALAPAQAHALVMALGFLPLFFAGFLFTAAPRWLQVPGPGMPGLLAPTLAILGGWVLLLPALHWRPGLVAAALLPVAAGHSLLVARLLGLCRRGAPGTRLHALLASAGCALCAAALWATSAALALGRADLLAALLVATLWVGVGGVFVVASHRLSPWIGGRDLGPLLAGLLAQGLWSAAQRLGAATTGPGPALLALCLGVGLAGLAARTGWGLRSAALPHGQRAPMLRLLRAPAGWLVVALGLAAAAHGAAVPDLLASHSGGAASPWPGALGMAATHALALGFFGGTLLAMASRVAAVHSGRSVASDRGIWRLHRVLQALVLGRIVAALLAPLAWAAGGAAAGWWALVLALLAMVWALIAAAWAGHAGPWLLQQPAQRPLRARSVLDQYQPVSRPPD